MNAVVDYTELQKERALDAVRRGKVDDFHPHDPERMDSFADVEVCASLHPEFAQALAKAKVVGSRALLGRIHEISQSPLRADDKRAQTCPRRVDSRGEARRSRADNQNITNSHSIGRYLT